MLDTMWHNIRYALFRKELYSQEFMRLKGSNRVPLACIVEDHITRVHLILIFTVPDYATTLKNVGKLEPLVLVPAYKSTFLSFAVTYGNVVADDAPGHEEP